jgi:NitT/TauT family transport system ATP-binding protein
VLGTLASRSRYRYDRAPIVRALDATHDGTLHEQFFLDLLACGFGEDEVRAQLATAIGWDRYGELPDFDADTGELVLSRADSG